MVAGVRRSSLWTGSGAARRAGGDGLLAVQAARRPAAEPVLGALDVREARQVAGPAELAVDDDREADALLVGDDGADRLVLLVRELLLREAAVGELHERLAQRRRAQHASDVVHSQSLQRHEPLLHCGR